MIATTNAQSLETLIKAQCYGLGFDLVGITDLGPATTAAEYDAWLARGFHAGMEYMARNVDIRHDARRPYDGATHAVVVAMSYGGHEPSGPVARYARGDDYHDVMTDRLRELHRWIEAQVGREVRGRPYVDTGPILERDLARRAGLGWFGKNTMLINRQAGSFFFLGCLALDLELAVDEPFATDHCGTCTRCIEACPTDALVEPRVLDANRCISYLTIENKGEIPDAMKPLVGELIYGCDICQEVCPWNEKFALPLREEAFRPRDVIADRDARTLAVEVLAMSDEAFRAAFKGSPMKRAKLRGLKRNAAVVLGNIGSPDNSAVLGSALDDPELLARSHGVPRSRE